jgi:antitoxin HigA-1
MTDAAQALEVARKTFSELLNGRIGISRAMTLRLAKAFGTSAEYWLAMPQHYDLSYARKTIKLSTLPIGRDNQAAS